MEGCDLAKSVHVSLIGGPGGDVGRVGRLERSQRDQEIRLRKIENVAAKAGVIAGVGGGTIAAIVSFLLSKL